MMQVTSDQWLSWLSLYFWPLLRVLALISTAPILSERSVPKRVKLGLAMMITFAIAPSLPANDVPVFFVLCSVAGRAADPDRHCAWFYHAICLCRCANRWRNYRSANGGCHLRRLSIRPAISICLFLARIMDMLALLLFLTFNGHLWLISLLVDTFHTLPIGGEPLNSNAFLALTKAGSLIFP